MHPFGNGGENCFGGGFMMLLLYIIIAFVIVSLFMNMFGKRTTSESSLEILNKRYATGEITKEQFEEIKRKILQ